MSVKEKTKIEAFTKGGDVFSHKLNMFGANLWRASWKAGGIGAVLAGLTVVAVTNSAEREVWQYYQVARLETAIKLGDNKLLARRVVVEGKKGVVDLGLLRPYQIVDQLRDVYNEHLLLKNLLIILVFLAGTGLGFYFISWFFRAYGEAADQDEIRRGGLQTTVEDLNKAIAKSREGAGDYTIAGVSIPRGCEMYNVGCLGPMGTGKSVLINDLMEQVVRRGKKAIVYDKTGEFAAAFFREGKDILLSPLDTRSDHVNPFDEIEDVFDFRQITASIVPMPDGGDPVAKFFAQSAQTVIQSAMEKLWQAGEGSVQQLYEVLCVMPLEDKREFLAGTEGALAIGGDGDQTAGILQTVSNAVDSLRYWKKGTFKLREWVARDDDSRIFIVSSERYHDVMKGTYYLLMDLALRAAMAGPVVRQDRLWIFIDELFSLGALPILKRSLTEARKFGIAHVVGFQHLGQIREIFGQNISEVTRSNLQTFVAMRLPDAKSRKEIADDFGSAEIDENSDSLSFGAASSRDGSGMQTSRRNKEAVTEAELKKLKNLEGFLQIVGDYDPVKVSFAHLIKDRKQQFTPFVMRPELKLAAAGSGKLLASKVKPAEENPPEAVEAIKPTEEIAVKPVMAAAVAEEKAPTLTAAEQMELQAEIYNAEPEADDLRNDLPEVGEPDDPEDDGRGIPKLW